MSTKRFWWSVAAVWFVMVFSDFLFHGVWLHSWYQQTAQFWRPEQDIQKMMPWMWVGQAVFSWAFVWVYSNGISKENQWMQAFRYAMAILLLTQVSQQISMWAMVPYPGELVARWLIVSTVQAFLASFVMTWTYKPMAAGAAVAKARA